MPEREALRRLLDQHAQPVDRLRATGAAGPGQERNRRVAVAQVHRQGAWTDDAHRQRQHAVIAAGRGGIDDAVEHAVAAQVVPVARMHAAGLAERVHQRVGAFGMAVDDIEFADARVQQRRRHAVRGAAGAEKQGAATAQVQCLALGEVAHQAGAVGVVADPVGAVEGQRIGRAGDARAFTQSRAQRGGGLLVRQGDVGAAAAGGGEHAQCVGEGLRRHVDRLVAHRHAELARERGVDARRQGMRDGMAEHGVAGGNGGHRFLRGRRINPAPARRRRRARNRSGCRRRRRA